MKSFSQVKIREENCIGCTKCIQACPFDAIIGASQQMHTVLIEECTGCQLCIPPCPMDCIDIIRFTSRHYDPAKAKQRVKARNARLLAEKNAKNFISQGNNEDKQSTIQAAIMRVKAKKTIIMEQ